MDATPKNNVFAERIYEIYTGAGVDLSSVKMAMTVREPVSRQISWYHHLFREFTKGNSKPSRVVKGGVAKTFETFMQSSVLPQIENGSNQGLYGVHLQKWFDLFPRENILIMSYDEFKSNQTAFLERIHLFLDLPIVRPLEAPRKNSEHVVNEEPIPCEVQSRLAEKFEESNAKLYKLLEENPGPPMELAPFPKFEFKCE